MWTHEVKHRKNKIQYEAIIRCCRASAMADVLFLGLMAAIGPLHRSAFAGAGARQLVPRVSLLSLSHGVLTNDGTEKWPNDVKGSSSEHEAKVVGSSVRLISG